MKNKIVETCFTFLALFLFSCGFAAAVVMGMMLMPVAFIVVFILAIREIIIWKRKKKLVKSFFLQSRQKQSGIINNMIYSNTHQKIAA